jgi:hypothetical protein
MKPTSLICAVTGAFSTRQHNPELPVTPPGEQREVWRVMANSVAAGRATSTTRLQYQPPPRILVEPAGFDLAVDIAVFPDVKLLTAQQNGRDKFIGRCA